MHLDQLEQTSTEIVRMNKSSKSYKRDFIMSPLGLMKRAPGEGNPSLIAIQEIDAHIARTPHEIRTAFYPEIDRKKILTWLLEMYWSTEDTLYEQGARVKDVGVLGIFSTLLNLDRKFTTPKELQGEITELYRQYSSLNLPEKNFHAFIQEACVLLREANTCVENTKAEYFSKKEDREAGMAMNMDFTHSFLLEKIGDLFPPPATDERFQRCKTPEALLQDTVDRLRQRFLHAWSTTSGFPDIETYRKSISEGPLLLRRIAERLRGGDFSFIYNFRVEDLEAVQKGGIQNIHQVGDGTFSRDSGSAASYHQLRSRIEAALFGLSKDDYHSIPLSLRPKSFSICGGKDSRGKKYKGLTTYGHAVATMKSENIATRAFLTVGDSLNTRAGTSSMWDLQLIPVEFADVLAPLIYDAMLRDLESIGSPPESFPEDGLISIISYDTGTSMVQSLLPHFPPPLDRLQVTIRPFVDGAYCRGDGAVWHAYVEALVFGEISPNDIESIRTPESSK